MYLAASGCILVGMQVAAVSKKIGHAFRWWWREVRSGGGECLNCHRPISTGNPNHPCCSPACETQWWQAQQW